MSSIARRVSQRSLIFRTHPAVSVLGDRASSLLLGRHSKAKYFHFGGLVTVEMSSAVGDRRCSAHIGSSCIPLPTAFRSCAYYSRTHSTSKPTIEAPALGPSLMIAQSVGSGLCRLVSQPLNRAPLGPN